MSTEKKKNSRTSPNSSSKQAKEAKKGQRDETSSAKSLQQLEKQAEILLKRMEYESQPQWKKDADSVWDLIRGIVTDVVQGAETLAGYLGLDVKTLGKTLLALAL